MESSTVQTANVLAGSTTREQMGVELVTLLLFSWVLRNARLGDSGPPDLVVVACLGAVLSGTDLKS